jgi:hypothetical protein
LRLVGSFGLSEWVVSVVIVASVAFLLGCPNMTSPLLVLLVLFAEYCCSCDVPFVGDMSFVGIASVVRPFLLQLGCSFCW